MAKCKYDPETFPLLVEGYAREGLIESDIAKKLGISVTTFKDYKNKYPSFLAALKRGKAPVDIEVENKLLERAKGYDYEETKIVYVNETDINGKDKPVIKEKVIMKKHMAADVGAIMAWLYNRKPSHWKRNREGNWKSDLDELQQAMAELAEATKKKEME